MLPRAILFDLDDTIIAYRKRDEALTEVVTEFVHHLGPVTTDTVVREIESEYEAFWADPTRNRDFRTRLRDGRRRIFASAFTRLSDCPAARSADIVHAIADRFHDKREKEMSFFPGAIETVDAFRGHGVKMALVTNGAREVQRIKIEQFDLARRFHHVQVEEEAGFGKPDERAYHHALKMLGVQAHETWMVGDNLENDVGGPQRLGIHGIWHDHKGTGLPADAAVRPDRIVRSLRELLLS